MAWEKGAKLHRVAKVINRWFPAGYRKMVEVDGRTRVMTLTNFKGQYPWWSELPDPPSGETSVEEQTDPQACSSTS